MKVVVYAEIAGHVRNVTIDVKASDRVETVVQKYAETVGKRKSPFRGGHPVLFSESGVALDPNEELGDLNIKDGTTLFLRVQSRKDSITHRCKYCLCVSFLALLASVGGVVAVVLLQEYWNASSHHYQYGIVIDAGSSHTSLKVYRWPGDKKNDTGVVKQHKHTCHSDGGAISQYVNNPNEAGPSLKNCLDNAMDLIPHNKQKDSPIFLGATAGMRMLNESNTKVATEILQSVRNFIASYPFDFKPEQARIISGDVEGVSGWITINYLLDNFFPSSTMSRIMRAAGFGSSNPMSGALDLGGASEQITFVPQSPPLKGGINLRLYGQDYTVYTHSYLCYGRNEANRQLLAQLVKASNYSTTITNPCAQKGYIGEANSSDVFKEPCTANSDKRDQLPDSFRFTGSGDVMSCAAAIKALFPTTHCPNEPCGIGGAYQPTPVGLFHAFSGFADAAGYLNISGTADLSNFQAAANRICQMDWQEIEKEDFSDDSLRNMSCFLAQYIYYDLTTGLKINSRGGSVSFLDEIDDTHLGWTLGFMINATNMLPSEMPHLMSTALFAELLAAFGLLTFIILFCLLAYFVRRKCSDHGGYVALTDLP